MRQGGEDGEGKDEPASADDGKSEECSSSHASLRVVEESVDTGVGELSRIVVEEEEVRVKPSCVREGSERRSQRRVGANSEERDEPKSPRTS